MAAYIYVILDIILGLFQLIVIFLEKFIKLDTKGKILNCRFILNLFLLNDLYNKLTSNRKKVLRKNNIFFVKI